MSDKTEKSTLKEYEGQFPEWNAKLIADTANYLYEKKQKEQLFYPIWTKEAMAGDPAKQTTGIAAFPLQKKAKFVLICPGGGYGAVCSLLEGYPLARKLNDMGYAAFVLRYRVGEDAIFPNPLEDVAAAIRFILQHALEFNLDTDDYCMMGFSAGAHLVGCFGLKEVGYGKYDVPKPETVVLGYPWITLNDTTPPTVKARSRILGEERQHDAEQIHKYSIDENVTEDYPSAFVFQCDGDKAVSIENALLMVSALRRHGVPCGFEVFHYPTHALRESMEDYPKLWWKRAVAFWEERYQKND